MSDVGKTCYTVDGKTKGKIISESRRRHCGVEDCSAPQLCCKWADGRLTWVCFGSMTPWKRGLRIGSPELWKSTAASAKKRVVRFIAGTQAGMVGAA